jgi:IMP dehydrogenase/GMP reductase
MNQKFDFKDITLVPENISSINHRYQVDLYNEDRKLPIIVSPMDTVVSDENYNDFLAEDFEVCLPRGEFVNDNRVFISFSLDEFQEFLDIYDSKKGKNVESIKILVDVANGHMQRLYDLTKRFCENRVSENHKIMIGNIANPKTYETYANLGVDYIRVGIGGGSGCLTSANTGIHYPMASLINECYTIKLNGDYNTKIVADGGFRNYDDIIKALALGADYVMLGGVLNKCLESCGEIKLFGKITINENTARTIWRKYPKFRKYLYKSFRGMSTKEVQKKWNRSVLKTSEGIVKLNKIEYTLKQWSDNLKDYLKSAMSYTNSEDLNSFKGSEYVFISENALKRFNK